MKCQLPFLLAFILWVIVALVEGQGSTLGTSGTEAQTLTIDRLFKGYDKRIRPIGQNGCLNVSVNILVLDVFDVDETKHEFKLTMFLRQHWLDSRLQYTRVPGLNHIVLDADHVTQLWTPDTFILNERNSIQHNFGTVQHYTGIRPDGRVLQSSRVTVTASCKMTLGYFPFDRQLCLLELASYVQSGGDYSLQWTSFGENKGARISEDMSATSLNFRFAGIKTITKSLSFPSGNQTRLGLEFFFARHSMRFVQDVFFPTFCLTVVALLTLYCPSTVLRVQLSVVLMIAMTLFISLTSSWMPRVSYQTALDLYTTFSASMIFITLIVNLLQYNFQISSKNQKNGLPLRDMNSIEKCDQLVDYDRSNSLNEPLCEIDLPQGIRFGSKVDEILKKSCTICRKYLVISYFCFNVIFWLVVLIGSSWYPEGILAMEEQQE